MRAFGPVAGVYAIALIALAGSPQAVAKGTGLVFVSSEKDNTITVLDGKTDTVTRTIDTCDRPRHMEWNQDHTQIYVACGDSDVIGIVDITKFETVDELPYIRDPEAFKIDWPRGQLYVSNEEDAALSIYDIKNRRVVTSIEVGEEPEGVMISKDRSKVWVTAEASNLVHVIDIDQQQVLADILVDTRPRRFAAPPDERELWVSCELAGKVDIIDPKTYKVTGSISFLPPGMRPEQVTPVGLVITKDGKTAYVGLGRANHVAVVDVATRKVTKYILVGERPWGLTLTADEKKLYVTNGLSDDVSIIDTQTLKTIKSVRVGQVPYIALIDD
jgi:PQQ-dependent catabolism-associated beta-propeller protein